MAVIRSDDRQWTDTSFDNVQRCELFDNGQQGGSYFVRLAAGATVPEHQHLGWEHVYVVTGEVRIGDDKLAAGDFVWTGAGSSHDAEAITDCVFLVTSEKAAVYAA